MLQRVDVREESRIRVRDPELRTAESGGVGGVHLNGPAFLVVGTLQDVTAAFAGLFSRNPVKIVRKSWA
jgi:hypothetical protein